MSRKHFVLIAAAIKAIPSITERENVARVMARVCANINPRFNFATFYAACEVSI